MFSIFGWPESGRNKLKYGIIDRKKHIKLIFILLSEIESSFFAFIVDGIRKASLNGRKCIIN
jgi:hypothetical protein